MWNSLPERFVVFHWPKRSLSGFLPIALSFVCPSIGRFVEGPSNARLSSLSAETLELSLNRLAAAVLIHACHHQSRDRRRRDGDVGIISDVDAAGGYPGSRAHRWRRLDRARRAPPPSTRRPPPSIPPSSAGAAGSGGAGSSGNTWRP